MDKDTLEKIKSWYETAYERIEVSSGYRKARWYLQERIRVINLLLFQVDEKEYLKKLDCLFLLNTPEGDNSDFRDIFNDE